MRRKFFLRKSAARRRPAAIWPPASVEPVEARTLLSSTLVPLPNVRDLVFDPGRDLLYATAGSALHRYDPAPGRMLPSLDAGVALNGLDLTPDGSAVYAAGGNVGSATLVRFDLPGGTVATRRFGAPFESGYDVAIDSTGRGLVTAQPQFGTGVSPVRQFTANGLDLVDRPQTGPNYINSPMLLARSADRSVTLSEEPDMAFRIFDAASNAFSARANTWQFGSRVPAAVSPDGSLFAVRLGLHTVVFDRAFNTVATLEGIGGGGAFDARRDVFYGVDANADELVAFDTRTWRRKYRLPVGENVGLAGAFDVPGSGTTAVSDDGTKLFLLTGNGIRVIDLPQPTGQATRFELTAVPKLLPTGSAVTFTLTARDPAGEVATGYRGTVHFTSSDPAATLPADFTFTAADAGSKAFTVTLNSPGTHDIAVADVGSASLGAGLGGVVVHEGSAAPLVPVANARDVVFDPTRNLLYITTADGTIERFDPARGELLPAVQVGTPLNGADTTADGAFLYVADGLRGLLHGYLRKVNLTDGSVTRIAYGSAVVPSDTSDPAAWDVAVLNNGKALVTAAGYSGGATAPLRTLSLADDTVAVRTEPVVFGGINGLPTRTAVSRGADRSAALVFGTTSGGPAFSYDAASDLLAWANYNHDDFLGGFAGLNQPAVSRDGELFAIQDNHRTTVVSRELERLRFLDGINGGIVFDPVRDTLYGVNVALDVVIAYDTRGGSERYRVPIGQDVQGDDFVSMGPGNMAVNADGTTLFLITPQGVRVIELPRPTRQAASFEVTGLPTVVKTGLARTFTVTARDNVGDLAVDFRGTVHFSSSDPSASLPSDYTFTAADRGVKTFTVTFNTAGSHTVTATSASPAATGTSGPVSVHAGSTPLIPLAGARDLVFDAARGLLYVTTASGTVERFDIATQSLLAPVNAGRQLNGVDITPDGAFLYAAEGVRSATQAFVRKIDLSDGSVSTVAYPAGFPNQGAFDVTIGADGSVLFSNAFQSLREIEPGTATTVLRGPDVYPGLAAAANLSRGADRGIIYVNTGASGAWYDPATNAFVPLVDPFRIRYYGGPIPGAVSRDSQLFAGWNPSDSAGAPPRPEVWDRGLNLVKALPGMDGGMVFDPRRAVLYVVDSGTNELVAFDTVGWSEKYRIPIGEDVARAGFMGPGQAAVTDDGSMFFLTTPAGVRVIPLPRPTSDAGSFVIDDFPRVIRTGVPGEFTVRVYDQQGNFFPGYRGTVRFSASDAAAGLPDEYTFTAADAGVHTFTATFNTAGAQALVVQDKTDATALGAQTGIGVHAGVPGLLPIRSRRDLVYDPTRNMLYVTTTDGLLERFDLATQTLLSPLNIGRRLQGADITPDGAYLYAATWRSDGTTPNGTIAKIRLSDGLTTTISYPLDTFEGDPSDLAIAADGRAIFSGGFARILDLATGTVTRSYWGQVPGTASGTDVVRAGDRSAVYVADANYNVVQRYSAAEGRFPSRESFPLVAAGHGTSASRDGRYVATVSSVDTRIVNADMTRAATLPYVNGGAVFDPVRDVVYGIALSSFGNDSNDSLVAYDTNTWAQTVAVGLPFNVAQFGLAPLGDGVMTVSGDGRWLFINVPGGVRAVPVPAQNLGVVGRHVFYNRSAFDGNDAAATPADDNAIAPDKQALRPGEAATFANVTGYSRGINGLIIDVFRYSGFTGPGAVGPFGPFSVQVGTGGDPAAWADAPPPASVTYRAGAGAGGSDRVTLTWNDGAIRNQWVRVTVKANPSMGISTPDVFSFGNLVGETGDVGARMSVNALDFVRTRNAISPRPAGRASAFDHNRDGRVSAADVALARGAAGRTLAPPTAPAAPMPPPAGSAPDLLRQDGSGAATHLLSET